MRELSITLSEDEEEEDGPVKEDSWVVRTKAWISRTLAGMDEGKDDDKKALAFLQSLPCGGVLGSASKGRGAVAAPAAQLFAPIFNYKTVYTTATEEADDYARSLRS